MLPTATFFVEAPPEILRGKNRGKYLQNLFQSEVRSGLTLAAALGQLGWRVSVCSISLDPATRDALAYLDSNNVRVTHWVVVEDSEGYWTHKNNLNQTLRKADAVVEWCVRNRLPLYRLGVDLAKPISILSCLAQGHRWKALKLLQEYYKTPRDLDPDVFWRDLAGLRVHLEVYDFFRFVKPLLGGDVPYDSDMRVVEMLYTDSFPPMLQGFATKLLHRSNAIPALGILNGLAGETPGRDLGGGVLPRHLTTEDMRKVMNALPFQKEFYFFALNHPKVFQQVLSLLHVYS